MFLFTAKFPTGANRQQGMDPSADRHGEQMANCDVKANNQQKRNRTINKEETNQTTRHRWADMRAA